MSTSKDKLKNMMEKYLNVIKKNEIEVMYGAGTHVKIHSISFSNTNSDSSYILYDIYGTKLVSNS